MSDKTIIGDATFYLCDCSDVLAGLPDNSIDTIITDPPYGINAADYKRAGTQNGRSLAPCRDYGLYDWDKDRPKKEYFNEMVRISKNQIIFGGNYFSDYLPPSPCWIVWDKDNGNNGYADCELVYTNFKTAIRKKIYRWKGFMQQPGEKRDIREHPTQKPIVLMRWIIENYTKKTDVICDPFMGSGTTAIACHRTNRKFIGIEKEKKYFDIAVARYRNEIKQMRICDLE